MVASFIAFRLADATQPASPRCFLSAVHAATAASSRSSLRTPSVPTLLAIGGKEDYG
jgi:hypothetical protein